MPGDQRERRVAERVTSGNTLGWNGRLGARIVSYGEGAARLELDVGPELVNVNGVLHGGAVATLIDQAGTIAIMTADREGRPGVSTDLNVSFFAPAPGGATVIAEAQVLKIGKTLAFVAVDVRRADANGNNQRVAQGRMTKFQG